MAITKEMEKKSAADQKRATAVDLPNCNYHLLFPTERSYYTLLSMGWTKHRKGSTQAYPRTFGLRRRPVLSVKWLSSSSSSCVEPTSSHVICFPAVRRPPTGFVAVSSSIPISHHLLLQQSTCITSPELSFLAHNSCHLSLYSFLLMHTIAIHNGTSIDTLSTTASIRGTCQKGSQRYPGTLRLTVGLDPGIIRG